MKLTSSATVAALLLSLAVVSHVHAGIAYTEGASSTPPDLANSNGSATPFTLGSGTNTVSGSVVCKDLCAGGATSVLDLDYFRVNWGNGQRVANVSLEITGYFESKSNLSGLVALPTGGLTSSGMLTAIDGVGTTLLFSGAAAGPGSQEFQVGMLFRDFGVGDEVRYSYVFSIVVDDLSAVPEPSPYALLLAGLGALGFVARRRRQ